MHLRKIDLAANLFFEIHLLPGDLLFGFGDYTIGKCILNRDCYLAPCLTEKISVISPVHGGLVEPDRELQVLHQRPSRTTQDLRWPH